MKRFLLLAVALLLLVGCAVRGSVSEEVSGSSEVVSERESSLHESALSEETSETSTGSEETSEESVPSVSSSAAPSESSSAAPSEQTPPDGACAHDFGDTPTDTLGNLDIYTCKTCGFQKVVANGYPLG